MTPFTKTHLFQLVLASSLVACGDDAAPSEETGDEETESTTEDTNSSLTANPSTSASASATTPSTSDPSTTGMTDTDPSTTDPESTTTGEPDTTSTGETETTMDPSSSSSSGETEPTTTGLLECADENLGVGYPVSVDGDNTGSGDDISLSCSGDGGGEEYIYEYTTAEAGIYVFDTDGSALDSAVAVFDSCGGTELVCNDDIDPDTGNYQSRVFVPLEADTTYVVAVDSYSGEVDTYTLNADYAGATSLPELACSAAGAALGECAETGGESMPLGGTLGCNEVFFTYDIYEIDVTMDDCIHITTDNIDPVAGATGMESGDVRMFVIDANGDITSFDDETPCTDPTFGGAYACPEANVVASSTGTMLILIAQWGGTDCPDDAPYTVNVAVNGTDVDASTLTATDESVGLCF